MRQDGREIFFFSSHQGGQNDIYSATRKSVTSLWVGTGEPRTAGDSSTASDTRPSLSSNGKTLYFGSNRTGAGDIYVTTRNGDFDPNWAATRLPPLPIFGPRPRGSQGCFKRIQISSDRSAVTFKEIASVLPLRSDGLTRWKG